MIESKIKFVGLHAHSVFSVFDGLGYPKDHMDFADENGCDALALTDHGNMNGLAHQVSGVNSGAATVVHAAGSGTSNLDEIWLWANNTSGSDVKLTIEWGTATADEGNIEVTIEAESGLVQIIPGLILCNSKDVQAFAGTTDVILITGFVNRITA